jgi:hypothetical protein
MTTQPCRLCAGSTIPRFRLTVLKKHDVGFSRCTQCESLQTDPPFWLEDAYADQRRFFDTGAVVRNQNLQVHLWYIKRLFGFADGVTALDWGGGDGLFTRMMRDIGIDAYHSDKFATNKFAPGFEDSPGRDYQIITAFEVWEHLPDPAVAIDEIFSRKPLVHFLTTGLYSGQDANWAYLWPTTGRHVFFFSAKAMQLIAKKYGYSVLVAGGCTLFYRCAISRFRRGLLLRVLSGKNRRLFHAIFLFLKKPGFVESDRTLMLKLNG